jgi:hypothetical protein
VEIEANKVEEVWAGKGTRVPLPKRPPRQSEGFQEAPKKSKAKKRQENKQKKRKKLDKRGKHKNTTRAKASCFCPGCFPGDFCAPVIFPPKGHYQRRFQKAISKGDFKRRFQKAISKGDFKRRFQKALYKAVEYNVYSVLGFCGKTSQ